MDTSSFAGCAEIALVEGNQINTNGLQYPVFVSRLQEWKKFDIIWTFRSKLLSEGIED